MTTQSTAKYLRARAVIDRQIRKHGAPALLRRSTGDRACWAMEAQLSVSERNALKSPKHMIFSISAVDLDVPPDYREDALITFVQPDGTIENPPLRQVAPPAPFRPGGIVVYWDLTVEG